LPVSRLPPSLLRRKAQRDQILNDGPFLVETPKLGEPLETPGVGSLLRS
jgi:hypothetical protein